MWNLPNLLTGLRLVLTPFIIWTVTSRDYSVALGLFAAAALTDFLDGWIARYFDLITRLGTYLDPVADKVLMSGVFLALGLTGVVPWFFVMIVLGRDIYMLSAVAAFFAFTSLREFPPSQWGKWSTVIQIITAALWIARTAWLPSLSLAAVTILLLSAFVTIWSGIDYTRLGVARWRQAA